MWGLPFRHDSTLLHYHYCAALVHAIAIKTFSDKKWEERIRRCLTDHAFIYG